ncbi:MAG: hypothetical protein WCP14_02240 [bacterium]
MSRIYPKCIRKESGCYNNVYDEAVEFAAHVEARLGRPVYEGWCDRCIKSDIVRRYHLSLAESAKLAADEYREKTAKKAETLRAIATDDVHLSSIMDRRTVAAKIGIRPESVSRLVDCGLLEKSVGPQVRAIYVTKASVQAYVIEILLGRADLDFLTNKEISTLERNKVVLASELNNGAFN